MKKIFLIYFIFFVLIFAGCTSGYGNNEDKVEISGNIIEFDGDKVSILSGDIAADYEIGEESLRDYYIGEKVKILKSGWKKYKIIKDEKFYYEDKTTNFGEEILKVSGEVIEKNDKEIILSSGNKKIRFANSEIFTVAVGSSYIIKYIKGSEENKILSIIDKESEMCLSVKDIVREDDTGIMRIETVNGLKERYDVCIVYGTILEVDPYDIKINDDIFVYPKNIDDNNPRRIDAKLISK